MGAVFLGIGIIGFLVLCEKVGVRIATVIVVALVVIGMVIFW